MKKENLSGRVPAKWQPLSETEAFRTTLAYVVEFYPLWFTHSQWRFVQQHANRLAGPVRISPIYHFVVAINDDTLYASSFLNLTDEPLILTIPSTAVTYSVLTLDPYGDIFASGIQPQTPGTYALMGPGFNGTIPAGVIPIKMPLNYSILIFRADKFSNGEDQTEEARQFRASLTTQPLSDFLNSPSEATPTKILPEIEFAISFKKTADDLIAKDAIRFLTELQRAVAAPNTPPLSKGQQALSTAFNGLLGNGENESELIAGAQAAHEMILERYLTHTGPTNWITFTNIGDWGDAVIERSAISEFIQFGNGHSTAVYYHAFQDGKGAALDGSNPDGYVLTFPKGQPPEAKRFWSLTAYTPAAVELVPNKANKYVVASYTGPQPNADGSLSVYLARELPADVPEANWLPIPQGPFNIMLRFYGPEGSVADNTYIPPAINSTD